MSFPADISTERIEAMLRTKRYGRSLDVRDETGSTNDDAQRAADAGAPDGHVVVANTQRKGRGAHGHAWSSPAGTDLYFSIVARVPLSTEALPPVTLAVGLAIAEAVETLIAASAIVKWPNDVLVQSRKCAGVLVETTTKASARDTMGTTAIIGVGINVNRQAWEPEIASSATSLALVQQASFDRAVVLACLLDSIEQRVDNFVTQDIGLMLAALTPRLAWRGERVRCGDVQGILLGVNERGALHIRTATHDEIVHAGSLELDR